MKKILLCLILGCLNYFAFALTRTWIGVGSGGSGTDISLAANWNLGTPLLITDDYKITLNGFPPNNIYLTQSTALTFKSLVIIWTATGNAANQKIGLITISHNLTITNNLDIQNTATTGNWHHPFEWAVTGGTSQYGSINMYGGGMGEGTDPDMLTISVTSPGVINCTGGLALDNPATFFTACRLNNAGTFNVYGTTTFNNLQGANNGQFYIHANNGGRFNFHGDVLVSSSSDAPTFFGSDSAVQSTGTFYFYRNVNLRAFGRTYTGANNAGTFVFDSTGAQTLTCSNPSLVFSNVKIGDLNSPTLTLAGSPRMGNSANTANLTINNSAVLVLPSAYTFNRNVSGGTLTIPSTGTLKLTGTSGGISGSNFPNLFTAYSLDSTSTVEFNGTTQTIPGTTQSVTSYGNLTTSGTLTKTLGSNIEVYRQLSLGAGTTFDLGNYHTTLKSNNKTTAYVAPITATISYPGSGRFIVERYISCPRKWHFLSIPTDSTQTVKNAWQEGATAIGQNPLPGYGMQITQMTGGTGVGFDAFSPGHSLKYYNPGTNTYTGIANTTDGIKSTRGYMAFVRGDRTCLGTNALSIPTTLRTKGKLYTGVQATININTGAFASIGNPFASPINLLNLSMAGLTGTLANKGTVYLWDPSLNGSYGVGAFQTLTFNLTSLTYDISPGGGVYTGNAAWSRVESGQAFYVKGGLVAGTVIFDEAAKGFGSLLFSLAGPQPDMSRQLRANLYSASNGVPVLVDGVLNYFDNAFPTGRDNMDAEKISGTGENVGLRSDGRTLEVDYRSLPGEGDTLFLNTANLRAQHYSLEVLASHLQANGRTAFLEDIYMHNVVPLDLNGNVTLGFDVVNIPGSYAADRFRIVFKQQIFPVAVTNIKAERNTDKTIIVKWNVENEVNVTTLEVENSEDGIHFNKLVNKTAQNSGLVSSYMFDHKNASFNANFYRIKSTETTGSIKYSDVAKVEAFTDNKTGMSIYPNPVKGGKINILFDNMAAGNYNVKVTNSIGRVLHTENITVQDSYSLRTVNLNPQTNAGTYQLTFTDNAGKKTTISFIIP